MYLAFGAYSILLVVLWAFFGGRLRGMFNRPPPPLPLHLQVVERDLLLQEKEKLYKEMKDILARQVGCRLVNYADNYIYMVYFYSRGFL